MIFFNHISTLPLTVTGPAGYPASVFGGLVAVNGLVIAVFEMGTVHALAGFRRFLAPSGTWSSRSGPRLSSPVSSRM